MSQEQLPRSPIELAKGFADPELSDREEARRFVEAIQPRDWDLFREQAGVLLGEAQVAMARIDTLVPGEPHEGRPQHAADIVSHEARLLMKREVLGEEQRRRALQRRV